MGSARERDLQEISLHLTAPGIVYDEVHPSFKNARNILENNLGLITHAEVAIGGLVSYVYRVTGEKQSGIVKIKGTHLAKIPDILIHPKDAEYEWAALRFLFALEPNTFPQPIAFDKNVSMILMSNIIPEGKTLGERLDAKEVALTEVKDLGNTVARIHKKLATFKNNIREEGDNKIYNEDLRRRLGFQGSQNHIFLTNIVNQLAHEPKQLIIGDLSPKNIGRGKDRQITICDLESFYRGNLIFAYGYLAGHILLYVISDQKYSSELLLNLLEGYKSGDNTFDFNNILLKKITLGSSLYRLNSATVPYPIALSQKEKVRKVGMAFKLLEKDVLSWSELINTMVNA